ncbi:hypothetical protein V6N11_009851 [Hibiscus sabdariffa]|uniref:RNase H type-1 domain-containing protein n=1 Tax=Hibiscus sabdariffa TaxID=183260 RepID=A0ABR1ZYG5_9ROSI
MLVQAEANAVKRWDLGQSNRSFIAARSWKQAGHVDTLLKEANAILLGIKWLLEMQVRLVEIENDSLVVIRYLTSHDCLVSSLGHLIDDIKSLSANFRVVLFKHVLGREINRHIT